MIDQDGRESNKALIISVSILVGICIIIVCFLYAVAYMNRAQVAGAPATQQASSSVTRVNNPSLAATTAQVGTKQEPQTPPLARWISAWISPHDALSYSVIGNKSVTFYATFSLTQKSTPVPSADLPSFLTLTPTTYAKDKNAVYCDGRVLPSMDPNTLSVPFVDLYPDGGGSSIIVAFAKDKSYVYMDCSLVPQADPETFKIITNKNNEGQDVFSGYAIDKNRAYFFTSTQNTTGYSTVLPSLSETSQLRVLSGNFDVQIPIRNYEGELAVKPVATSDTAVYSGAKIIPQADPKSVHVIRDTLSSGAQYIIKANKPQSWGYDTLTNSDITAVRNVSATTSSITDSCYIADKGTVFLLCGDSAPMVVPDADLATFVAFGQGYAASGGKVLYNGSIVSGADPSTIVIGTDEATYDAFDNKHLYFRGRVVQ